MTGLPVRCRAGRAGGPRAWDTEGQRPCARGAGGLAGRRDGPTCQEGVRSALPNRGRNGVSALRRDPGPDPSGLGGAPQLRVHSPGEPAACAQGRARHLENPSCQGPEAEELAEPQGGRRTHRGCWEPGDLRALWGAGGLERAPLCGRGSGGSARPRGSAPRSTADGPSQDEIPAAFVTTAAARSSRAP